MSFRKVLLGIVMSLVVGVIVVVTLGDDSLDPAVERALRVPERLPLESNLYYPITGFTVAGDKDPAGQGYTAVTRVNEVLRARISGETGDTGTKIGSIWVESVLDIEDPAKVVCSLKEEGCIASLRTRRTELLAVADEHPVLMARYRQLANFPEFQTDVRPHLEMPLPRFATLLSTHRLVLGVQILGYLQGDDAQLGAVLEDLRFVRRLLAQADNMLTKMVAVAMTADALHAYAALMDRKGSNMDRFPVLAPLVGLETSLDSSLTGEFRFVASSLNSIEDNPGRWYAEAGLPPWLAAAGLRPLFKPNRTLNQDFSCWQAALAMAGLPPGELITRGPVKETPACKPGWYEWLVNPIGTVLKSIAGPDFRHYAGRLHDLNGLVTLVNLKRAMRKDRITADGIADYLNAKGEEYFDPYTREPMQWDSETRSLGFSGAQPNLGYDRLPLEPLRQ